MAFNSEIRDDELFHIMIHADIDTVTIICSTHHLDYCNTSYFWKLKFGHDELPILINPLPTTFKEWRQEYLKMDNAAKHSIEILNIKNKGQTVIFDYNSEQFNFKRILPYHLKNKMYQFNDNYKTFKNLLIKATNDNYYIKMNMDERYYSLFLDLDDIYDVLTIIFYYYPNITYYLEN
jgi:hypothetical protein